MGGFRCKTLPGSRPIPRDAISSRHRPRRSWPADPRTRHRRAELRGRGTYHPHRPGRLRRARHRGRNPGPQHQGAEPARRHGRRLRRPAQGQPRPAHPAALAPARGCTRPAVPRHRSLPQGNRLRGPGRRRPAGHASRVPGRFTSSTRCPGAVMCSWKSRSALKPPAFVRS